LVRVVLVVLLKHLLILMATMAVRVETPHLEVFLLLLVQQVVLVDVLMVLLVLRVLVVELLERLKAPFLLPTV
jgi:hypothetical protein